MNFGMIALAGAILAAVGTLAEGIAVGSYYEAGGVIAFGILFMLLGLAGVITFEILNRIGK